LEDSVLLLLPLSKALKITASISGATTRTSSSCTPYQNHYDNNGYLEVLLEESKAFLRVLLSQLVDKTIDV
jgi:hypothetical protein